MRCGAVLYDQSGRFVSRWTTSCGLLEAKTLFGFACFQKVAKHALRDQLCPFGEDVFHNESWSNSGSIRLLEQESQMRVWVRQDADSRNAPSRLDVTKGGKLACFQPGFSPFESSFGRQRNFMPSQLGSLS